MLLFVLDQKNLWRETIPSCKQKECPGARDVLQCAGKKGLMRSKNAALGEHAVEKKRMVSNMNTSKMRASHFRGINNIH